MNAYALFLAETLVSLSVSLAVLRVLSGPLVNVLGRICPDQEGAAFWLSFTNLMLMIVPLLLVLAVDLLSHVSDPLDSVRLALIAALTGLLAGLHTIGHRLGQFVVTPIRDGRES